ncbi:MULTISPECIES: glycosyltransferase [unclassified Paenibacillus]|uniref:glycosyltransferase n=1 Tax=unclassified Paenibacillus TaxID=185978 RepID=UPI002119290D|nr:MULTISPECIES: glycosyltransferase [unclassified Paenibacillus]
MSNQKPFYLWKQLEGEREHDRFGHRIVSGDINGDGHDEWIIAASTATHIEDEYGVNPIPHYYTGKLYVYSQELRLLFILKGEKYGECFGSSVALADMNGDGICEIIVGAPRSSSGSRIECGTVSVFSGRTGELLDRWDGQEDYAKLGTAITILDWNGDGVPDIAVSSHYMDPDGLERNGRVTIFSGADKSVLAQFTGVEREGLGFALASGDVNGDGRDEIVIGAPRFSKAGAERTGRVLIYSQDKGLLYESAGRRSYDEFGYYVSVYDMDGDGAQEVIVGSPKASGEEVRCGTITIISVYQNKILLEKEGWFGLQELGSSVFPLVDRTTGTPMVLAGARAGSSYVLNMGGEVVHEFNGSEAEVFGYSVSSTRNHEGAWIAIGAISGMNQKKFMSGCVYFMSSVPPIEPSREAPILVPVTPTSNSSGDQAGKKILLATYWYLPHVGGVDVYVRLLKEQLERAGHQVDVLAHHPDMAHYYLVNGGEMVEKWPIKSVIYDKVMRFFQRFLSHVDPWIRYREIERYCFEVAASLFDLKQYDVIHTQDIISTRALSRVKPPSTALVATIHGLLAKEHLISGEIRSKESLAWKYASDEEYYGCISADSTIVPAHWLRRELAQFGVPPQMLTVIPYGMDTQAFEDRLKQPFTGQADKKGAFTISCIARLVPVKGHRILLGALRRLTSDPSWHCWLIGDGPLHNDIQQLIIDYALTERVTLLGDQTNVPYLLNQSDLMVLPSLQDNLPFSIMEAQLSGVPIVASNAGGIPEMIQHEKTGLLFEVDQEEELAHRLVSMMNDPLLRESLAAQAKEWALKQWSSVTLIERTMAVYDEALKKVKKS